MMQKINRTIFQLRRDKLSEWEKYNPILRVGEPGYAYDENVFKIGDGISHWKDLQEPGVGVLQDIVSRLDILENGASLPNKEVLSTITEEMISSWGSSETKAKEYSDALFSDVDAKISTAKEEVLSEAASNAAEKLSSRIGDIPDSTSIKDYVDNISGTGSADINAEISNAKKSAIESSNAYTDSRLTIIEF